MHHTQKQEHYNLHLPTLPEKRKKTNIKTQNPKASPVLRRSSRLQAKKNNQATPVANNDTPQTAPRRLKRKQPQVTEKPESLKTVTTKKQQTRKLRRSMRLAVKQEKMKM